MADTAYLEKEHGQRRYKPQIGVPIDPKKLDFTQYKSVEKTIVSTWEIALMEHGESMRLYQKGNMNGGFVALVYDGVVNPTMAGEISQIANSHPPYFITAFYDSGNGVRGFDAIDRSKYQEVEGSQLAFEVHGTGELEKKTINAIKEVLLKAR